MSAIRAPHGEVALRVAATPAVDGLIAEFVEAGRQIGQQARSAATSLRRGSPWAWTATALWLVGILGDALTTLLMMRTGRFEEANGAAAALMGVVGVSGWVLLSSLLCVAIATLTLARPRGTYAWAAAATAVVVCAGKLDATVGNTLLWVAATA